MYILPSPSIKPAKYAKNTSSIINLFTRLYDIVAYLSAGKLAIAVNPNGTTQNCSNCGTHVPKTIADRWHSCPVCGLELDRDVNAAINIKNIAVGRTVIKAQRVTEAKAGVAEKPTL